MHNHISQMKLLQCYTMLWILSHVMLKLEYSWTDIPIWPSNIWRKGIRNLCIGYIKSRGTWLPLGRISATCAISVLWNDGKYEHTFTFSKMYSTQLSPMQDLHFTYTVKNIKFILIAFSVKKLVCWPCIKSWWPVIWEIISLMLHHCNELS